jgi:hypothetical protein
MRHQVDVTNRISSKGAKIHFEPVSGGSDHVNISIDGDLKLQDLGGGTQRLLLTVRASEAREIGRILKDWPKS